MSTLTKEQFKTMTSTWRSKKEHRSLEYVVYNLLRAKKPELGFKPISKESKLKGGKAIDSHYGYHFAVYLAICTYYNHPEAFKECFGIEMPPDLLDRLRTSVLRPEDFSVLKMQITSYVAVLERLRKSKEEQAKGYRTSSPAAYPAPANIQLPVKEGVFKRILRTLREAFEWEI